MTDIYNYNKNINITATPNGDIVMTMNKQILTSIICLVAEAKKNQEKDNRQASADDTWELFQALYEKEHQAFKNIAGEQ